MTPSVESIDQKEIEDFCAGASYEAKLVPKGFVPENDADRLMIVPPATNVEQMDWDQNDDVQDSAAAEDSPVENKPAEGNSEGDSFPSGDLDDIRRRLEGLL